MKRLCATVAILALSGGLALAQSGGGGGGGSGGGAAGSGGGAAGAAAAARQRRDRRDRQRTQPRSSRAAPAPRPFRDAGERPEQHRRPGARPVDARSRPTISTVGRAPGVNPGQSAGCLAPRQSVRPDAARRQQSAGHEGVRQRRAADHQAREARARRQALQRGSPGRARTTDLTVNSRPLYRLSYRGTARVRLVDSNSATAYRGRCNERFRACSADRPITKSCRNAACSRRCLATNQRKRG